MSITVAPALTHKGYPVEYETFTSGRNEVAVSGNDLIINLGLGVTMASIIESGGDLNDYILEPAYRAGYRFGDYRPAVEDMTEMAFHAG